MSGEKKTNNKGKLTGRMRVVMESETCPTALGALLHNAFYSLYRNGSMDGGLSIACAHAVVQLAVMAGANGDEVIDLAEEHITDVLWPDRN